MVVRGKPFVVAPTREGYLDVVWWLFPKMARWDDRLPPMVCEQTFLGHCVVANPFPWGCLKPIGDPNPVAADHDLS